MAEHSNSSGASAAEEKEKTEGKEKEDELDEDKVVLHKHEGASTHERYIDHNGKVRPP